MKKSYYSVFYNILYRRFPIHIRRRYRLLLLFLLSAFLRFAVLDRLFPLHTHIEYSIVVTAADSTVLHAFLTADDKWRMMTELREITPTLKKAIIYKEDKYFSLHPGINPGAILRAAYNNLTRGRRTSGASTITMQVARLLDPKERNYFNKLTEMFRALQLEFHYSKNEILQLYLNLVPYGGNIEGVKAAAILYFDKSPDHLSLAEITALSIIPNRPNSMTPGKNNDLIKTERDKWLRRFAGAGLFEEKYIADALDEPLTAYRHEAPALAPHFCRRIRNNYPSRPIIRTTLDLEIQRKVEELTLNHSRQLWFRNIRNAAVLVIDNRTKAVTAYVGSADFNNLEDAGQVDGITAVRSPGSTLKPLLYAIAIDKGLITPKTVISDVPVNFSGYEPENYDGKYYGNVTVEYALANSLNIPAVKLLEKVRPVNLADRLITAGFRQIGKDRDKLGLSMVLGGCGTTLDELTRLFGAFADTGVISDFQWLSEDTARYRKPIVSSAAAFMVTEILTTLTRPDLPTEWHNSAHLPCVAWKTGTSYGRRDAWSIGYNKNYTVGVWVGNFSGTGVPELNGAGCAAPLLFRIFNAIDYDTDKDWNIMPASVDFRYVCSETGLLPNDFCRNQVMDYYIPMVSPNGKCRHLRYVWMSADSSVSYCSHCLPEKGYIKTLIENYKPEIIAWFDANQVNYKKIPPHNPECERVFAENAPVIISPVNGTEYFVDRQDSMQIMLSCNAALDSDTVYWYVNDRFYASCGAADKVFFTPNQGPVKISCTDDKGRNTDIRITVKEICF
ncbi:MAG: penicillin-binding protein 1C [Bacteroidetes bacterium]|nr:penicillin-binding protein 1C [Bacteroidota bacterium]